MVKRLFALLAGLSLLGATPAFQVNAPHLHYHAVAYYHGKVMWTRDAVNMVTTEGCTELINATFKAGTQHTFYIGEIKGAGAPTFNIADDLASHAGWTAIASGSTDITDANYPALTLGSVTGTSTVQADNSGSIPTFHQNSSITIQGFYLSNDNVVGDNAGSKILYGEAALVSGAPVLAGYTVQVTVTIQMTAA
jgi:hypothetical protein